VRGYDTTTSSGRRCLPSPWCWQPVVALAQRHNEEAARGARAQSICAAAFEGNGRLLWLAGATMDPATYLKVRARGTGTFPRPLLSGPGGIIAGWARQPPRLRCWAPLEGWLPAVSTTVLEHGGGQTVVVQKL